MCVLCVVCVPGTLLAGPRRSLCSSFPAGVRALPPCRIPRISTLLGAPLLGKHQLIIGFNGPAGKTQMLPGDTG